MAAASSPPSSVTQTSRIPDEGSGFQRALPSPARPHREKVFRVSALQVYTERNTPLDNARTGSRAARLLSVPPE
ncbi:hypothetical protein MTO96_019003 [Rhipicephalus appendiculatus]